MHSIYTIQYTPYVNFIKWWYRKQKQSRLNYDCVKLHAIIQKKKIMSYLLEKLTSTYIWIFFNLIFLFCFLVSLLLANERKSYTASIFVVIYLRTCEILHSLKLKVFVNRNRKKISLWIYLKKMWITTVVILLKILTFWWACSYYPNVVDFVL